MCAEELHKSKRGLVEPSMCHLVAAVPLQLKAKCFECLFRLSQNTLHYRRWGKSNSEVMTQNEISLEIQQKFHSCRVTAKTETKCNEDTWRFEIARYGRVYFLLSFLICHLYFRFALVAVCCGNFCSATFFIGRKLLCLTQTRLDRKDLKSNHTYASKCILRKQQARKGFAFLTCSSGTSWTIFFWGCGERKDRN